MVSTAPKSYSLTQEEKQRIQVCKRIEKGIVNVRSTKLSPSFYTSPLPHKGSGSGFIIDNEGHVVTSYQTLSDIHAIEVTLFDGTTWPARFLGCDHETDIAVLSIRAPEKKLKTMAPLLMTTTDRLSVGQEVIAAGNPFGTGIVVQSGIISSGKRSLKTSDGIFVDDVIQTDITVNEATVGGPLVDLSGRVLGMNSLIFNSGKQFTSNGFVLPSETVLFSASHIISKGFVTRAWLGATLQTINPTLADLLDLPVKKGAMVTRVAPRSPAAKAGLKASRNEVRLGNISYPVGGDIITAVDGKEVTSSSALMKIVRRKKPGQVVTLSIFRGDRSKRIKVRLGEKK